MSKTVELKMIDEFQCPGCVCGSSTKDGCLEERTHSDKYPMFHCVKHVPGTFMHPVGTIFLGLPIGFNRLGAHRGKPNEIDPFIRLWDGIPECGIWDDFNVPVWAMEKDGHLFVRTYLPRNNLTYVDVVKGGKLLDVPNAIDVGKFIDEID